MAKKKASKGVIACLSAAALVLGGAGGAIACIFTSNLPDSYEIPETETVKKEVSPAASSEFSVETIKSKDLSIHFMELGNKYTGDSTLIKVGDVEVLIDAGSKTQSVQTIYDYASQYVEGALDYIIVTHAHEDHYAGFATASYADSIFGKFNVGEGTTIIDFAQTTPNKKTNKMYKYYDSNLKQAVSNNAKHYTALEALSAAALNNGKIDLGNEVTMTILKTKFYTQVATTENDHSVCTLISQANEHNYLLTGDLEEKGEESLIELNNLPEVDVYKAGHHGSKTSSSKKLMEKIKPAYCAVCCCAGSSEYTSKNENQFPTQIFIDNIAPYTDKVYVTSHCVDYAKGAFESMNGNIIFSCSKGEENVTVNCSNNTTLLKDTQWFKDNRILPEAWKSKD